MLTPTLHPAKRRVTQLNDRRMNFNPVCGVCAPLLGGDSERNFCVAFPEGILLEIWSGKNSHTESYLGDHGIQLKPKVASLLSR